MTNTLSETPRTYSNRRVHLVARAARCRGRRNKRRLEPRALQHRHLEAALHANVREDVCNRSFKFYLIHLYRIQASDKAVHRLYKRGLLTVLGRRLQQRVLEEGPVADLVARPDELAPHRHADRLRDERDEAAQRVAAHLQRDLQRKKTIWSCLDRKINEDERRGTE